MNAMLGVDELGKVIAKKDNKELLAILLVGHKKGGTVPRCSEADLNEVRRFSVFGLKAWSRLEPLPSELLSRSITISMVRNDGRRKLKGSVTFSDFADIRDELYLCRINDTYKVRQIYNKLKSEDELYDRTKDLFLPLLTIAYIIDKKVLYKQVLEFAQKKQLDTLAYQVDIRFYTLLELILEHKFFGETRVTDIRDAYRDVLVANGDIASDEKSISKITSQKVLHYLERLGFKKTDKFSGGRTFVNIDMRTFLAQARVYLKKSEAWQKYSKTLKGLKTTVSLTDAEQSLLEISKT
jgi:hypothetical protein